MYALALFPAPVPGAEVPPEQPRGGAVEDVGILGLQEVLLAEPRGVGRVPVLRRERVRDEGAPHAGAGHGDAKLTDGMRTLGFSGADGSMETFDPVAVAQELQPHLPLNGGCLECVVCGAADRHPGRAFAWE